MSSDERIKRPRLDRMGPIRNWSRLLGVPPMDPGRVADGQDAAGLGDVVSRSVELGYRVVDEYIRQGQRAADRLSKGAYRPEDWAADARDLAQLMAQYASEFAGTWFELLQRASAATTSESRPSPEKQPAPSSTPAPGVRVRLSVDSTRPAQVLVELDPHATGGRLVVHALHASEAWKPRLREVEFRLDGPDESPTLHVTIPPHQPPGSYEGLIVDEATNRPVGAVRVCLVGGEQVSP
jgi:hypothetical protein